MKLTGILILFFSLAYPQKVYANEKIMSNHDQKCEIYVKIKNNKNYQKISCIEKKTYPIPNIGYDKSHCVKLRPAHYFYIKNKNEKFVKNKIGLYCSMNGFSNYAYWYYVE